MSTPAPITPPKRMLPNAIPLVDDFTIEVPGPYPSSEQLTDRSLKLRWTITEPGVVTYHVPLSFPSVHLAPATSVPWLLVVTDTDWFCPLTMEAQPLNAQTATAAPSN